ncbi:MAG: hypothetical protein ACI9KM_001131 [Rubritalea sp.]|jgi:hypothetical protein
MLSMPISRRKFIGIVGGGTIAAATVGTMTFLSTRTPNKALAPWKLAGGYDEPRRRALSFAILAPNPHNRQPWQVDLSQDNKIILYADTQRLLPHTDPFNRQITIGLGCFLELLRMAAAEEGYLVSIDGFPEGFDQNQLDKRPVASMTFVKNASVQKDPLFYHVLSRRSLKEPFDLSRNVPNEVLSDLENINQTGVTIATTNQADTVDKLRKLTHKALAIEIETPRTYRESVDLFRIGKSEVNANPDGIDFSGPMFDSLSAAGLFSRELALDTESSGYQQGIEAVMSNIDTAMGYVWLVTKSNTRIDQLNVGRDWLRVNLTTTGLGVGVQPVSQALQEYAEMTETFNEVHRLLNAQGKTVQMLGRLGYAEIVPPSPRWSIESKIIRI